MTSLKLIIFFIVSTIVVDSKPTSSNSITVVGSVFCDSCSENIFSKHSYFLQGAKVQIQCRFRANSVTITANKTTDQCGVYRLDIPPIDGFKCRKGKEKKPPCQAVLISSSSSLCNLTGLQRTTTHIAIKPKKANTCILNLNALNYRPPMRDAAYCGADSYRPLSSSSLDSSLFFWPLIPPFLLPWLRWPPLPFAFPPLPFPFNLIPLPDPSSLPFSIPPWLLPFLDPSCLPFPFSLFPPSTPSPPPFPPNSPWS